MKPQIQCAPRAPRQLLRPGIVLATVLGFAVASQTAGAGGDTSTDRDGAITENGRVVAVHDGDTFRMARDGGGELRVNLACADAPESGEPGAEYARAALSSQLLGNSVRVRIVGWDRGHAVGQVYRDGIRVGELMIRKGAAVRAAGS
ncbi:MAG: thermonuclease family protein [Gammaproteobacteria bacterium]